MKLRRWIKAGVLMLLLVLVLPCHGQEGAVTADPAAGGADELLNALDEIQAELARTREAAADARRREAEAQAELERLEAAVAAAESAVEMESESRSGAIRRPEAGEGATAFLEGERLRLNRRSNLRAGPGTTQPIVDTLDAGIQVTAYAEVGGWIRVQLDDGSRGWIFGQLLGAVDTSETDG